MSFEPKISSNQTTFTYDRLTWKDYLDLIGKGPRGLCEKVQPRECKGSIKDVELQKKCTEMFRICVQEARLFKVWSRMN